MRAPLVSIVCTNYNKGDWIADAIESFLRQEADFAYEILLIDDKSTDHSTDIIKKYAKKHSDIIRAFYNEKNLGITRTWIKVCKEARGKYIARCDGDDYWTDTRKLQKQVDLLRENRRSLWCSTDYDIITPAGEVTHRAAFESGLVDRSKSYAEMLATKGFTMSSTWLVGSELMKSVNADIDPLAVDDTFNIQLELFKRTELTYLPEATTVYRINEGSDSRPEEMETIRLRHKKLLTTQLEYVDKYKDVEYDEILRILLQRDFEMEMLAVERLKNIYEQREHTGQLEARIVNLEDSLNKIAESRTYRVVSKLIGMVRLALELPKRVLRKLRWLNGRHRYAKHYIGTRVTSNELSQQMGRAKKFSYSPLISIVVPMYNTDPVFFVEMLESVKEQTYTNWELVLVDDASSSDTTRKLIKEAAENEPRITTVFLKKNKNIAGATNEGIAVARGEYIALLDHDDILHPSALFEVVKVLNENDSIDFIYTDEDKMDERGEHIDPFLKPDWNQELLYSINYITHLTTIRTSLVRSIGGERSEYNGAQDWDLFLRATYAVRPENIYHIPKILYTWRVHGDSTAKSLGVKPYVIEAQKRLLEDNLRARGLGSGEFSVRQNLLMEGSWTVHYNGQEKEELHRSGDVVQYDKIKGIAMSEGGIMKFVGRESLTTRVYRDCQYSIEAELSGGSE